MEKDSRKENKLLHMGPFKRQNVWINLREFGDFRHNVFYASALADLAA